jgi:predicted Rdx family selenoprotein
MGIQRDDLDPAVRDLFPDVMFGAPAAASEAPASFDELVEEVRDLFASLSEHFEETRRSYEVLSDLCDPETGAVWHPELVDELPWEFKKVRDGMSSCYAEVEHRVRALGDDADDLRHAAAMLQAEALEVTLEDEVDGAPSAAEQAAAYTRQAQWLIRLAAGADDRQQAMGAVSEIRDRLQQWDAHRTEFDRLADVIRTVTDRDM